MPVIQLDLDSSQAVAGLKKYDNAVDTSSKKTETAFSKMRSTVSNAGVAIGVALAAGAAALTVFSLRAVTAASSMLETQGVFDQAFAGMTETAEQWATELGESYHLSELVAKQSLNTFQLVLTGMGVATQKAGEMSNSLVRVGADLGAAFDRSTVEVVNDIRSALSGSMEVMDKYGVVIRAAQVEQKALEMGLAATKQELTQADKATATYALILEKTATITGTTAREAEGYAGQLKEARKNIDNLTSALGDKMLPIFTQVLTAFNNWITTGDRVNTIIDYSVEAVRFLVNGFFGLELVLKGTIVVIAKLAEGFVNLAAPMNVVLDAMVKIGAIDSNPVAELQNVMEQFTASAIEGLGTTWDRVEKFNASMDRAKTTTDKTTEAVVKGMAEVAPAIEVVTNEVEESLIPAEIELEQQVKKVTAATKASTSALQQQASAASSVSTAAQALIGGPTSQVSPAPSSPASPAPSGGDSGGFSGGTLSQEYINAWKPATPGFDLGYGDLWERQPPNVITNNFNQQVSKSDIIEITQQQTTNEARA